MTIDHDNDPEKEVGSAQQILNGVVDLLMDMARDEECRKYIDEAELLKNAVGINLILSKLEAKRAV